MQSRSRDPKPVPALVRFKAIMDTLATDSRPRSASDLARELSLPRSTVHGLCRTLADLGVLARVNETEFVIGSHVLSWTDGFHSQHTISRVFSSLADGGKRAQSLNLSVLTGRDVTYIACREGTDPLAVRFRVGLRFPAVYTATGKAILSTMPDWEVATLMHDDWPEPPAPNSVRTLSELRRDLDSTRERGFSIDNGQLRPTLYSCGAAVIGPGSSSTAIAGVSVAMPSAQADEDLVLATGREIAAFAKELSRRLGAKVG